MALVSKSIDEVTTELADVYDSLIAPNKIWRDYNNKLYLILRAFAAGKVGLVDTALALHNRFDPRYCDDLDLYSTAKLVGTDFRQGTGSMVNITVTNTDTKKQRILRKGTYSYKSISGTEFYFQLQNDRVFEPEEEQMLSAISAEKGSYPVERNTDIKLSRTDGIKVDGMFAFSCEDNAGQLGFEDETPYDFRVRLLSDTDRQDHIKELELKIRNLPNIFECNLVLNESPEPQEYDGFTLAGKELLITITGVPTDEVAELVAKEVLYATHKVDPENVVYYYNDLYINGKYPVYFKYHDTTDFSLAIVYQYDKNTLKQSQIEDAIEALFMPLKCTVKHIDVYGEGNAYKLLEDLNLPNVKILDVNIIGSDNEEIPFVRIPKTRLPRLTGIAFTAMEMGEQA
jgi:hypothetical protein